MKDKKTTTESFDRWDNWAQPTYRTGGTKPPKSNGGLVAFLLALIIFLCGISTGLGLMNIRLFQQLTSLAQEETCSVVFSQSPAAEPEGTDYPLGFKGQAVSEFWQNYHELPPGIYVTQVAADSDACRKGVQPGDVLTHINDTPITDAAILEKILQTVHPGDSVSVMLHRDGQQIALSLLLE